jgi:ABC-type polysaccharide/polyol phosphate transport system ATPase subunit
MIHVQGISKKFKLYHSPADRLREILLGKQYHRDFTALEGVTFEVRPGETLGIIGQNGAGKSTILKILSGIVIPDDGEVHIDGKVTGVLELGTGFNFEMTGLENIAMNGILLGMTRQEIDLRKQQIIDFSELGDFIDEPLKTYSSGMVMRLAFSVAIHADPACFLVDEALSVGDAYFQQKCIRKIQEFKAGGGSIIFVSHDLNMLATLCDTAMLLEKGKVLAYGRPQGIIDLYISIISRKGHQGQKEVIIQTVNSEEQYRSSHTTTQEIEFLSMTITNTSNEKVTHVFSESDVIISFTFRSHRLIENPVYGILLRNRYGVSIFGTNTYLQKIPTLPILPEQEYTVSFRFKASLQPDDYLISLAVDANGFGINSFEEYLLRLNNIALLKVIRGEGTPFYEGITDLHPVIDLEEHQASRGGQDYDTVCT